MKVYINEKIDSLTVSATTHEKFGEAETMLQLKGYETENPASDEFMMRLGNALRGVKLGCFYEHRVFNQVAEVMLYNMRVLSRCDAIYMLSNYIISNEAQLKMDFAEYSGIRCMFQDMDMAQLYLKRIFTKKLYQEESVVFDESNKDHIIKMELFLHNEIAKTWLPIR